MSVQSRVGRVIARGAFSFSLAASPLMLAGAALGQAAPVAVNAPPANMSNHDAALDAAHRGDYIAAVAFAKKAAADGMPLDPDQVDFMTDKAAKQQAALDAVAKTKAAQATAEATAAEIEARQQKDYAARERAQRFKDMDNEVSAAKAGAQAAVLGAFAQEAGGGQSTLQPHSSEFKTQANAVNSTTFAVSNGKASSGRPAQDCLTLDQGPNGSFAVAANKCSFKVTFAWCVEGAAANAINACTSDGAPPHEHSEVDAHGRLSIPVQVAGLKLRAFACEAPNTPQQSGNEPFVCK